MFKSKFHCFKDPLITSNTGPLHFEVYLLAFSGRIPLSILAQLCTLRWEQKRSAEDCSEQNFPSPSHNSGYHLLFLPKGGQFIVYFSITLDIGEGCFVVGFEQKQQLKIMCVNKMLNFTALFQYLLMSSKYHKS